jgi:hypothetical protein
LDLVKVAGGSVMVALMVGVLSVVHVFGTGRRDDKLNSGLVSMVMLRLEEAAETLPALSVALAVIECVPCESGVVTWKFQVPVLLALTSPRS